MQNNKDNTMIMTLWLQIATFRDNLVFNTETKNLLRANLCQKFTK